MKKTCTRLLAALLAVCLLLTAAPLSGFAGLELFPTAKAYAVGDHIEFGTYPQSRVTDTVLIKKLISVPKTWKSYQYYSGTGNECDGYMASSDYMQFADFFYEGNKYRAVTFSYYRPYSTHFKLVSGWSSQKTNGYTPDQMYYFRYEPIEWKILDPTDGLILSESILDAQAYQNTVYAEQDYWQDSSCSAYANDYAASSIRSWLNYDFYETAFTDDQKASIRDDVALDNNSTWFNSRYDSDTTYDSIFLLSYNEAAYMGTDTFSYGPNPDRYAQGTDYAESQGLRVTRNTDVAYNGNSIWLLRTPTGDDAREMSLVESDGSLRANGSYVYSTDHGVRAACRLFDLKTDNSLSPELFSEKVKPAEPAFSGKVRGILKNYITANSINPDGSLNAFICGITVDNDTYSIDPDILTENTVKHFLNKHVEAKLEDGVVIDIQIEDPSVFYEKSYIADIWMNLRADNASSAESELLDFILNEEPLSESFYEYCKDNTVFQEGINAWNGMQILFDPGEAMSKDVAKTRIYETLILDLLNTIAEDTAENNTGILKNAVEITGEVTDVCTEYNDLYIKFHNLLGKNTGTVHDLKEALEGANAPKRGQFTAYLKNVINGTKDATEEASAGKLTKIMKGIDYILEAVSSVQEFYERTIAYVLVVNMTDEMAALLNEMRDNTSDEHFQTALDEVIIAIGEPNIAAIVCTANLAEDLILMVTKAFIDGLSLLIPVYNVMKLTYDVGVTISNLLLGTQGAIDAYYLLQATQEFIYTNRKAINHFAARYRVSHTETDAANYVCAVETYRYVFLQNMDNTVKFLYTATESGILQKSVSFSIRLYRRLFNIDEQLTVDELCSTAEDRKQTFSSLFDHLLCYWKYNTLFLKTDYPDMYAIYVTKDLSNEVNTPDVLYALLNLAGETLLKVAFADGYYNEKSGLYHSLYSSMILSGIHVTQSVNGNVTAKDFSVNDAAKIKMYTEDSFSSFPKTYRISGFTDTENGNAYTQEAEKTVADPCRSVSLSIRKTDSGTALHIDDPSPVLYYSITKYHIQRKTASSDYTEIAVLNRALPLFGGINLYTDTTANKNETYSYRVITEMTFNNGKTLQSAPSDELTVNYAAAGNSDLHFTAEPLTHSNNTGSKAPALRAVDHSDLSVSQTGILLHWDTDPSYTDYEIYRKASYAADYTLLETVTGETAQYTDQALESGADYSYMLLPVSEEGGVRTYFPSAISYGSVSPQQETAFVPGDVDNDGKVTAADARLALRRSVDLETYAPGSREFLVCDVDGDGCITAGDARRILRAATGLEDPSLFGIPDESDLELQGTLKLVYSTDERGLCVDLYAVDCIGLKATNLELSYDSDVLEYKYVEDGSDVHEVSKTKNDFVVFEASEIYAGEILFGLYFKQSLTTADEYAADSKKPNNPANVNSEFFHVASFHFDIKDSNIAYGPVIQIKILWSSSIAPSMEENVMPGDVDNDGKVTAGDARLALRRSVDLETYAPGTREYLACDVDGDGKVTAADARLILRAAVGLETLNPASDNKAELLTLYKNALENAENAGYTAYTYYRLLDLQATGNSTVDNVIKSIAYNYMVGQSDSAPRTLEKGSIEAKNSLPTCTLTDVSKIRSATSAMNGDNTVITLVMEDEPSPMLDTSFTAQLSKTAPLLDRDLLPELNGIEQLKLSEDPEMTYRNFTVTAELTPDGRLVRLTLTAPEIDIVVRNAKLSITTIEKGSAQIMREEMYTGFEY